MEKAVRRIPVYTVIGAHLVPSKSYLTILLANSPNKISSRPHSHALIDDSLDVLHLIGRLVVDLPLEPVCGPHHLFVCPLLHVLVFGEGIIDPLHRVNQCQIAGQDEDGALRRDDVWRDPAMGICMGVGNHGLLQIKET